MTFRKQVWMDLHLNRDTINFHIGSNKIQSVLWRYLNITLPQSLKFFIVNNLDTDNPEKINIWSTCVAYTLRRRISHLRTIINRIISRDEKTQDDRRQKLLKVNYLLEKSAWNTATFTSWKQILAGFAKMVIPTKHCFIRATSNLLKKVT